ncbi:MAG: M24 family metallopeptidase [Candidatus Hadarchaeales archaeon]
MRKRISRVRAEMSRRGLDAFITTKSVRYLSGTTAGKAVIVPLDGEPVLICSRLELGMAKKESRIRNVIAFSSWRSPLMPGENVRFCEAWQIIAECLRGYGSRSVGHDGLATETLRKLRSIHAASYRGMPALMWDVRKVKFPEELAMLRASAKIAAKGMKCAGECISPGRSELEVAADAEREMRLAGSEGTPFGTIVASGPNSWMPHARTGERRIKRGDLVVVDLGAIFRGYASDMTRTFSLGADKKAERMIEVVRRAQRAGISRVRERARACDVDEAVRRTISGSGFSRYCLHGSGHGVGMDIHEPPSLAPNSRDVLQRRMVVTVEPGVYVPGIGGARWEDMVEVESKGCSVLTHLR